MYAIGAHQDEATKFCLQNKDVYKTMNEVIEKSYDHVADEMVGGTLHCFLISNGAINEGKYPIKDSKQLKKCLTKEFPYHCDLNGNLVANNANISGKITMTSGSISWSSINSDPTISTAQNTANNANSAAGTAQSTANTAQSIANSIAAGTYTGGTFISGKVIYSPDLRGGSITSDTTISVGTDITIGNNIYFKPSDTTSDKSLIFGGRGNLTFRSNGVTLAAFQQLDLNCSLVTYNDDEIATKEWVSTSVVAKFG
jgi:hypothetical protein